MSDIQVGEYVRTNNGTINQIKNIIPYYENGKFNFNESYVDTEDFKEWKIYQLNSIVKKHSPNIIDLIEEFDYVNGYPVRYITDVDTGEKVLCNFDLNTMEWTLLKNIDIWYDVVTHEQFSSMEYRLGGNEE